MHEFFGTPWDIILRIIGHRLWRIVTSERTSLLKALFFLPRGPTTEDSKRDFLRRAFEIRARYTCDRSGFPVKIKEQENFYDGRRGRRSGAEGEGGGGKEIERRGTRREKEEETKRGAEGGEGERGEREDRWSDFTLGLFSDGRRYGTPSRACSATAGYQSSGSPRS